MPFLSQGFRPFFLAAAVWAALSLTLWIGYLATGVPITGPLLPIDWHAHALVFGYGGAVLCGFLLTAIPNWTNRPPVSGAPLAGLVGLWLLARFVFLLNTGLPFGALVAIDLAFPALFCFVAGREIIAGGNKRNLPVVGICTFFLASNALFHWDPETGTRSGIAVLILLICLIGGRIIPAFTRNWLKARGATTLPAEFGTLDKGVLIGTVLGLVLWITVPDHKAFGVISLALLVAHFFRLSRWCGMATRSEPLLFTLHIAYGFVALGFGFAGATTFLTAVPAVVVIHTWTIGAIGTMTLTVMARATLGHSGHDLHAGLAETAFLLALPLAAIARIASAFPGMPGWVLHVSAGLWIAGFALFVLRFAPVMFVAKQSA